MLRLPGDPLRRRSRAHGARDRRHRGRARGPARRAGAAGQAAGGPAAAHAHHLRHRDDAPGRLVLGHRELLAAHRRPRRRARHRTLPARLLPRGLPAGHRRVARHGAADRRDVRGRHVAQARRWSTTASGCRARWTTGRCKWEEFLERIGQTVYLSATPGAYELAAAEGVVEQIIRPTGLVDPRSW